MQRSFLNVLLLVVVVVLGGTDCVAESTQVVDLGYSSLSTQSQQTQKSRAASTGFALRLSQSAAPEEFQRLSSESVQIPVLDADGAVRGEEEIQIEFVSNLAEKYGALVSSTKNPRAVHGALLDRSSSTGKLWSIAPFRQPGLHEVSELSSSEVFARDACESLALTESLKEEISNQLKSRQLKSTAPTASSLTAGWREVQAIIVSSSDFTRGRSDDQVIAQIISTVSTANIFYEPLQISIKVVGVQIFRDTASDPYGQAIQKQRGMEMLETVRNQWFTRSTPEHDVVAVFAKGNFGSVYGLAYPATSCLLPRYSVLFASQGSDTTSGALNLAATFAHELGHIIGMDHDSTFRPEGPSLMWPYFVTNPNGFSQVSTAQYSAYKSKGGTECFSEIPAPPGSGGGGGNPVEPGETLVFEGGNEQAVVINEGDSFSRVFRIQGNPAGIVYRPLSLPDGVEFNPNTQVLSYTPSFGVASRANPEAVMTVGIAASFGTKVGRLNLILRIKEVNRAPELKFSLIPLRTVEAGSTLVLDVIGQDADVGEVVNVVFVNAKDFAKLPGKKQVSALSQGVRVVWELPINVRGEFAFLFEGKDLAALATRREFRFTVTEQNLPPVTTISELSKGNEFEVSATDPEGKAVELEFQGLPEGSIVEHGENTARVFLGASAQVSSITVIASDGVKSTKVQRAIAGTLAQANSWPGAARSNFEAANDFNADGQSEVVFYSSASGVWEHASCESGQVEATQFGGFIGDLPVEFMVNRRPVRALYRVILGQGYWVVQNGESAEVHAWGLAGDVPVPGDYDGDGTTDLVVYRPLSNQWFMKFSAIPVQVLSDTVLSHGEALLRVPFSGDIDGDGLDDRIFFIRQEDGNSQFKVWTAKGQKFSFVPGKSNLTESVQPFILDIDRDGRSDLLVERSQSGRSVLSSTGLTGETKRSKEAQPRLLLSCGAQSPELLTSPGAKDLKSLHLSSARTKLLGLSADLDGNGAADVAVWRGDLSRGRGKWFSQGLNQKGVELKELSVGYGYPLTGRFFSSSSSAQAGYFANGVWTYLISPDEERTEFWGQAGDIPVAADYNGDGRTDLAVFRPGNSSWWILNKGSNGDAAYSRFWGEIGDVPVPADYDGDGAADIAIFRPSTGSWYVRYENGAVDVKQLGGSGDLPIPGDYLGRGYAQLAVWRRATGTWIIQDPAAPSGVVIQSWGLASDVPLLGDYNGDGRIDFAVWRPEEGSWYILEKDSLNAQIKVIQWGLPSDIPLGSQQSLRVL